MSRDRDGHIETELQFEAPDLAWVERWLAAYARPGLTLEPREEVLQDDEYLDSESFVIYRAGYALRLRRVEGKPTVATLKAVMRNGKGPARRTRSLTDPDSATSEPSLDSSCSTSRRLAGPLPLRITALRVATVGLPSTRRRRRA